MNRIGRWTLGTGVALGTGLALWTALGKAGAEAAVKRDGALIDLEDSRLHVVDRGGDGLPVVMLHGLLGQLRHFSYALTGRLGSEFRPILVDRPGWGWSQTPGPHPSLERQAALVAALIERLGLERPVVVGHSMGGALALRLALDRPDLVGAAGLIAPLTRPVDTPPDAFGKLAVPSPLLRELLAWTVAVPMGTITAAQTARKVFAPDPVPEDFVTRGGGALSLRPASFRAGSAEMMAAPEALAEMTPRYGEIAAPTAILYGREDALLDPEIHGRVTASAIRDATLEIVAGGHMLPISHPDVTEAWLRRLVARREG